MPDPNQSSSTQPSAPEGDDNPFAAPPEGRPDQPWRPRRPDGGSGDPDGTGGPGAGGPGSGDPSGGPGSGTGGWSGQGPGHQGPDSRWSGYGPGQGPGRGPGDGREPSDPSQGPPRWDPTDPAQRRARYALLSGMWAFFFTLFGIPSMGLLLGSLAMYWGISSLRSGPTKPATPDGPAVRPLTTAAISGLLTAGLALVLTAGTYAMQLAYKDFYVCRDDALTKTAELKCNTLLPDPLRNLIGVKR